MSLLVCIDKGGLGDEGLARVVQLVLDVRLLDLRFGQDLVLKLVNLLKLTLLNSRR